MIFFKHKHFSQCVDGVIKTLEAALMVGQQEKNFFRAMKAALPSLIEAEHMVIDLAMLPDADEAVRIRLPHDNLLIGFERDAEMEEENTRQARENIPPHLQNEDIDQLVGRSLDAVLVKKFHYDEDFEYEEGTPDLLVIPIFYNSKVNSVFPVKWVPPGIAISVLLNENEDEKETFYKTIVLDGSPYVIDDATAEHMSHTVISTLIDITALTACSNVSIETVEPSGLAKTFAKKKKLPLKSFSQIKLPGIIRPRSQSTGKKHASPRFHRRRGHYRTYHRDERYERKIWIAPMAVGDPQGPKVKHDYVVRKK